MTHVVEAPPSPGAPRSTPAPSLEAGASGVAPASGLAVVPSGAGVDPSEGAPEPSRATTASPPPASSLAPLGLESWLPQASESEADAAIHQRMDDRVPEGRVRGDLGGWARQHG